MLENDTRGHMDMDLMFPGRLHMRRLLIVILCILALVVCRSATGPPTVVPPTGKPPAGDSPRLPQMTALVSATAFRDGRSYDLSSSAPLFLVENHRAR